MTFILDCIDKEALFHDYPELEDRNFQADGYPSNGSIERLIDHDDDERISEYLFHKLGWKNYLFFVEHIILLQISSLYNHINAINVMYQSLETLPQEALDERRKETVKMAKYFCFATMLVRYFNGNKIIDAWERIDNVLQKDYGIKYHLVF